MKSIGLSPGFVKVVDLNDDGVRDYLVGGVKLYDDVGEDDIYWHAVDEPYELIVIDGKTGKITKHGSLASHRSDDLTVSMEMAGNTPRFIYDRGWNGKTVYDYKNGKFQKK